MKAEDISALIDELFRAHRRIEELRYKLKRFEETAASRSSTLSKLRGALEAKQNEKKSVLVELNQREREAEIANSSLEKRREQLNCAKSDREYEAIKVQIELDEKKTERLTDLALETLGTIDEIDSDIKELENQISDSQKRVDQAIDELNEQRPQILVRINEVEQLIRGVEENLPRDFQAPYARAKEMHGESDATAPIVDNEYCGGCNQGVPKDFILKVKSGNPVCCSSCGRLLYRQL